MSIIMRVILDSFFHKVQSGMTRMNKLFLSVLMVMYLFSKLPNYDKIRGVISLRVS